MRARWLGLTCFLWLGASNASAAVEPSRGWIPERYRAQLLQMDSLFQVRKTDQAHAIVAALLKDARARRDSAAQLLLLRADGEMWFRQGLGLSAEPPIKEALGLAMALRDSAALCRGSWLLAGTVAMLGRAGESTALYRRALTPPETTPQPGPEPEPDIRDFLEPGTADEWQTVRRATARVKGRAPKRVGRTATSSTPKVH